MLFQSKTPPIVLPRAADMPAGSRSVLRWMWFFARPYRKTIFFFTIFRIVRNAILTLLPFVTGRAINAFSSGWAFAHEREFVALMAGAMAVYVLTLFSIIFYGRESKAEDRMVRGMTMVSIRHMNRLPLDWHEGQGSGSQLQRVMTARAALTRLSRIYRWNLLPFIGLAVSILISVFGSDVPAWMLLLYLGPAVTYPLTAWLMARPMPELHNRHNMVLEKLMASVYEFVSAVRTVKTFRMEGFIEGRAQALEAQGHDAMADVIGAVFRKWLAINISDAFWLCLIFGVCLEGVFHLWLSAGAFATCFFLASNMLTSLDSFVSIQDEFIEARNGFLRLTETLDNVPRQLDLPPVVGLPKIWRTITFDAVTFHYAGHDRAALKDITLSIARGEKVALVGRSGAGKSTLVKLLLKQAWPDTGMLRIGETDLRHIDSTGWLGQVGYVPQDVELFNLSIRDNILLDRLEQADAAIYSRAIEQAALTAFITGLPEGDATLVGERGIKLSGGQRQRLGIARALVRQAEIIIFDEATSALDSLSETAIREAMETAFADKTVILIAHRLATVRHVDRIFVLEDGRLVEQGSFNALLQRAGLFAQLWALQSEAGKI